MHFRVTIRKDGSPDETKTVEAPNRFAVYDKVRTDGGFVVSISERPELNWAFLDKFNIQIGTGIKRGDIVRLARNLSTMLSAGLAISRALSVIERQSSNASLKKIASGLVDAIKKGSPFHEALGLYPKVFPELFVAMVRAGEESGSLSESLSVVGLQLGRADELSRKVKGAMIYPAIVVSGIVVVAILMLVYVVPTLTKTFTSLGVKVPLATRVIVALSNFLVDNFVWVIPALIGLVVAGMWFAKTRVGSNFILESVLQFPVIGDLVRETYTARASRTLSSLLTAGVPVLTALEITRNVVGAEAFSHVILQATEHVKKGEPLSKAFVDNSKYYPVLMGDMLAVGEETGKVAEMLKQVAEFYEETVSEKTKDLSTIIEPILMLIIGVFVGIFAVAMIAPIYQLSSAV
jgi:type IV pilus assembly protein PilC